MLAPFNGKSEIFATLNCDLTVSQTIITVGPDQKGGWEVFESDGVKPRFSDRFSAFKYARGKAKISAGEIRILDWNGTIEQLIPFSESNRKT
jgi:hypothetical protein